MRGDRGGRLRSRAPLQGLAFRRARRRHLALGVPRAMFGDAPDRAPSRRSRTASTRTNRLNPGKIVRPYRMDDRALMRFPPGYARRGAGEDGARLVGMGRLRRRRRDVQQQRHLPQARRRHHVPVLPRDARRAARDARARQFAAARDLRPARPGRLHLARDEGDARPLRLLQGLPARMPDRRRHGAR